MLLFAKLRASRCRFPLWGHVMPSLDRAYVCGDPTLTDGIYCKVHRERCVASLKPARQARQNVKKQFAEEPTP
jgi:hypothetical protein